MWVLAKCCTSILTVLYLISQLYSSTEKARLLFIMVILRCYNLLAITKTH